MAFSIKEAISSLKNLGVFEQNRGILGVDIGTSSIKLVQLKKEKERAILETYGEIALGQYGQLSIGQAVKLQEQKLVEALNDIIRESNVKTKNAVVSIPLGASFVTIVDLPSVPEKSLDEMVRLEARRYVPVAVSEVFLDWHIIPHKEDEDSDDEKKSQKDFTRILLAATHKDVIARYKEVFAKANLNVKAFEIEIFSMARSSTVRTGQPIAIVDFGATTTKIIVVDYGIIRFSHSLGKGSQDITLALSRSLNVDFSRAEETKREIGLSNLPEHKEIVSIMEPELEYILLEVNKVIREYQKKYNRLVGRTVLTGGGGMLKGLVDFSVKRLNMEVGVANPFLKVEYPVFLNDVLKEVGPSFSIALGLALREL